MSAQHTPGPLMRDNFSVTTCAPAGEKRRTVAICSPDLSLSSMASMERMRANATLFAAAPDLLEACERIRDEKAPSYHDCIDNGEPECAWCAVFNAIAKATGAA